MVEKSLKKFKKKRAIEDRWPRPRPPAPNMPVERTFQLRRVYVPSAACARAILGGLGTGVLDPTSWAVRPLPPPSPLSVRTSGMGWQVRSTCTLYFVTFVLLRLSGLQVQPEAEAGWRLRARAIKSKSKLSLPLHSIALDIVDSKREIHTSVPDRFPVDKQAIQPHARWPPFVR